MNLANVIADPQSGRKHAVILDHLDYSQAVILQNRPIPWEDPMAYANFMGQAQGLLKPDAALLHLDRFYGHRTATSHSLQDDMSARSRTGFALRTMLADVRTLEIVMDIATTFSQTQREAVVLHLPSPMAWLATTHAFSGKDDAADLDADDAENASMYVADWLRNFSALPVAGVLLDDRTPTGVPRLPSVGLEVYTPVINVAENYRWTLGIRSEDSVAFREPDTDGRVLGAGFWSTVASPLPASGFYFSQLPATAVPEDVITLMAGFK